MGEMGCPSLALVYILNLRLRAEGCSDRVKKTFIRELCFRESEIAVRDFLFFPLSPTLCTTIAR